MQRTEAFGRLAHLVLLSLVILLFVPWAPARANPPFTVPISDKVVSLEISLPGAEDPAFVKARDGSMLTISNREDGYAFSLVPAIVGSADGSPLVRLLALEIHQDGQATDVRQFAEEDLTLSTSAWISKSGAGDFEVTLLDTGTGQFPAEPLLDSSRFSPSELRKIYGTTGGTCCVSCGPFTVCGDSVTLSCGSCDGGYLYK